MHGEFPGVFKILHQNKCGETGDKDWFQSWVNMRKPANNFYEVFFLFIEASRFHLQEILQETQFTSGKASFLRLMKLRR